MSCWLRRCGKPSSMPGWRTTRGSRGPAWTWRAVSCGRAERTPSRLQRLVLECVGVSLGGNGLLRGHAAFTWCQQASAYRYLVRQQVITCG